MFDAIVIGGGISGLSCAYRLLKRGFSTLVFESNRAGGLIQSVGKNGFLLECGPNVFLEKPVLLKLIEELGLASSVLKPVIGRYEQHVWYENAPHVVPKGPIQFYKSKLIEREFKWKILKTVSTGSSPSSDEDDCTVEEYLLPVLGKKATSSLLAPAMKGVYGASIKELSARSVFPGFWNAGKAKQKLIAYLKERRKENGRPRVFTLKGGIASLTSCLADFCEKENALKFDAVLNVEKMGNFFILSLGSGEKVETRRVFVASSGPQSSAYLRELLPRESSELDTMRYIPLTVVHLAIENGYAPLPKSFGILYPTEINRNLMGVMFNSQLFPHVAPKGTNLLTIMLGGSEGRGVMSYGDPEIITIINRELKETLGYSDTKVLNIKRWEAAIPIYPLGHYKLNDLLKQAERNYSGLHFIGTDLGLPGIADRVSVAMKAATAIEKNV
ncbi:MAG: protoporphyrinogen oxidase [SAR324 cluster bacterium]|uniref:Coproporphyrinogen III oxidase n=1 Tax=SAR324 cluster bacterium TaxID=2024889 RepID=A0A7X9FS07_9DELT|nr:protoporphyrinogen oxidase [SAR324 cluster bacterium]